MLESIHFIQRSAKNIYPESQQLIESALQTLHVINLNNLETNLDEDGHYLVFGYNVDTPDRITVSAYNEKKPDCYTNVF